MSFTYVIHLFHRELIPSRSHNLPFGQHVCIIRNKFQTSVIITFIKDILKFGMRVHQFTLEVAGKDWYHRLFRRNTSIVSVKYQTTTSIIKDFEIDIREIWVLNFFKRLLIIQKFNFFMACGTYNRIVQKKFLSKWILSKTFLWNWEKIDVQLLHFF